MKVDVATIFFFSAVALRAADAKGHKKKAKQHARRENETPKRLRKLHDEEEYGCCNWDETDFFCGTGGYKTIFEQCHGTFTPHIGGDCPALGPQGCCYTPWGGQMGMGGCSDHDACWCGISRVNCEGIGHDPGCGGCYCEYPTEGGVTQQEYEHCIDECQNPSPPEDPPGCCYQPWAGVMGMGGCSHADWCNLSEDNCEGTHPRHDPGCSGCWCPPGMPYEDCRDICTDHGSGGTIPPGTIPPPSAGEGCCYWEEYGKFCTGGTPGYNVYSCAEADGIFNPNIDTTPGHWHHGTCLPDETPGTCYDKSHCHWHHDHWNCDAAHGNEKPCWCSISSENCQGSKYGGPGCDGVWVPN